MAFVPKFTIRSANNSTEIYRFTAVQSTNLPQTPRETVTHTTQRGRGAVVIDGGIKSFEAIIDFVLWTENYDYTTVMDLIDTLETSVPINTPFILRMEKSVSTYYDYRVKRINPFEYIDVQTDQRLFRQKVSARFLTDAW